MERSAPATRSLHDSSRSSTSRETVKQGRRSPMSTAIDTELATRARRYASRVQITLSAVIEQSLVEYLARREVDSTISPLAEAPKRAGRPSKVDHARREKLAATLRKRTGRPFK